MRQRVVLASSNKHKLKEIKAILDDFEYDLVALDEINLGNLEIEETGTTFEENAYFKAKTVADLTGEITLADDSGLEVDALDGAPGIYSARYAGEPSSDIKNNKRLIGALEGIPTSERTARFVSTIVMLFPNGDKLEAKGTLEGVIGHSPAGHNGFGYDPLFIVSELNRCLAELSTDEKNEISHRANALKQLKKLLRNYHESSSHQ
ncbi:MAG: XTP/dITP diphosphatase [Clostridia bacterium]|nr:XTP/dITP diphosphatase [Clostridia bacterium]